MPARTNPLLLTTKLFAPPLRHGSVTRARLLEKMNHGLRLGSRLTLVTAPAGYGKTTLALQWLESLDRPYAWISLDREDNQPEVFFAYLLKALSGLSEELKAALQPIQGLLNECDSLQPVLPVMINSLAGITNPFILAADDYQRIDDLGIHQAVSYLLEHMPPAFHLVLLTRQDPLLPLSRLRSYGHLTEVRLGELRFTQEEADSFLNCTMALGLAPEQITALESRTEGWIAGLQLAALSLAELPEEPAGSADQQNRAMYIQAFTGDDRHVVDYLMDEVLSRQQPDVQRFLLNTSILKHLSAPLCDVVVGKLEDPESKTFQPSNLQRSTKILEYLERSNLFLIPLDNQRTWYRYHHLFSELLNSRLQAAQPEIVAELHTRASHWYEAAGMMADAVDHALLAENFDRALRLIEQEAKGSIWASGNLPILLNWSRRLPEEALLARPRLCLYNARGLFFNGRVEAAVDLLDGVEQGLRGRSATDGTADELWGVLFTNRATISAMQGDSEKALELAEKAKPLISAEDLSTQARIAHAVGMAELLRGRPREAESAFQQGLAMAQGANNLILGLDLTACLAMAYLGSGQVSKAIRTCEAALAELGAHQPPAACALYLALAQAHCERWELGAAATALDTAAGLGEKAAWPHVLCEVYCLQALVWQGLRPLRRWSVRSRSGNGYAKSNGSFAASPHPSGFPSQDLVEEQDLRDPQTALRAADEVARRYPLPRVARLVAASRARVHLAQGQIDAVRRWVDVEMSQAARPKGDHAAGDFAAGLFAAPNLAHMLLALGQCDEAEPLIDRLLNAAERHGHLATQIESQVLRASLLEERGNGAGAVEALNAAMLLAAPEGALRSFLSDGGIPVTLLARARSARMPAVVIPFAAALRERLEGPNGIHEASQAMVPGDDLVEPLSEREREVLVLLAQGLSNPEIAARLYLSVNTMRAHTSNIYGKLGVHNRVQAAARARELGLLPPD